MERAEGLYPTFNSYHEGYGVLLEEVDELWDAIKAHKGCKATPDMVDECIQIAAMVGRFVKNLSE